MKALILTAKCGMGHYNCAKAIEQILADNLYIKEIKFIDIYEEKFGKKASVFYRFSVVQCLHQKRRCDNE